MSDVQDGLHEFTETHRLICSAVLGPFMFFGGVPLDWGGDRAEWVWWVARDGKWISRESYDLEDALRAAAESERNARIVSAQHKP